MVMSRSQAPKSFGISNDSLALILVLAFSRYGGAKNHP